MLAVVGSCPCSSSTLGGPLGRPRRLLQPPRLGLSRLTCVSVGSLLVLLDRPVLRLPVLETKFLS